MEAEINPIAYLKEVYGLEPEDLELIRGQFTIEDVEWLANKFGLTRKSEMTLQRAQQILKNFKA